MVKMSNKQVKYDSPLNLDDQVIQKANSIQLESLDNNHNKTLSVSNTPNNELLVNGGVLLNSANKVPASALAGDLTIAQLGGSYGAPSEGKALIVGTGGNGTVAAFLEGIKTSEMDNTKVLKPNGSGGVSFQPAVGGLSSIPVSGNVTGGSSFTSVVLGSGLSGTVSSNILTLTAPGGGFSGFTVQDEGSILSTTATSLNFTGAGVTASGSGVNITVNVPGGGGSSLTVSNYGGAASYSPVDHLRVDWFNPETAVSSNLPLTQSAGITYLNVPWVHLSDDPLAISGQSLISSNTGTGGLPASKCGLLRKIRGAGGITVNIDSGHSLVIDGTGIGGGGGITDLNGLTGSVSLVAGTNITSISVGTDTLTINAATQGDLSLGGSFTVPSGTGLNFNIGSGEKGFTATSTTGGVGFETTCSSGAFTGFSAIGTLSAGTAFSAQDTAWGLYMASTVPIPLVFAGIATAFSSFSVSDPDGAFKIIDNGPDIEIQVKYGSTCYKFFHDATVAI